MEGATPFFTLQSAPPSGDDNCAANCALFPPLFGEVAPSTVIPADCFRTFLKLFTITELHICK